MILISAAIIPACLQKEIDGVVIKRFQNKKGYFKEGRYHAFGQENRKKSLRVARYYLKKALQLDPLDYATIDLLGSIYRMSERPDIEEKLYVSSLNKSPRNRRLHYALGRLYFSQKKYEQAQKTLASCIKLNSRNPFLPCYSMLAETYTRNGQSDRALKTYQTQLKFFRDSPVKPHDRKKIKLNPGLGTIHVKMAELYLNKKDYDRALISTSKAQGLLPRNWPAYRKASELISKIEEEVNRKPRSRPYRKTYRKKTHGKRRGKIKR